MEVIKQIIFNPVFISMAIFFVITVISQLVGTLKSIFVANKAGIAAYISVAIDALLYTFIVKSLTEQTFLTIILFVIGKIIGTFLGNMIESKIGLGIYDIDLYIKDHEQQKELQEKLFEAGISSTMNVGSYDAKHVRWSNNIQIKRRDLEKLYDMLEELNIAPNMVIRPAKKVTGKISEHLTYTN